MLKDEKVGFSSERFGADIKKDAVKASFSKSTEVLLVHEVTAGKQCNQSCECHH